MKVKVETILNGVQESDTTCGGCDFKIRAEHPDGRCNYTCILFWDILCRDKNLKPLRCRECLKLKDIS